MNEQEQTIETRAALEINAPKQVIWDIIKSAANAPILDPRISRAFKAEGTPDGVGEIQFYIIDVNGREQIAAAEVTEEVEAEFSIVRMVGNGEFTSRTGYFLTETRAGTELEIRNQITAPKRMANRPVVLCQKSN